MEFIKTLNIGLRFVLELCLVAALAFSGFHTSHNTAVKWLIGITLPIAAATVWGLFIAPKAAQVLGQPQRLILEILLFGAAVVLLYMAGQKSIAVVFMIAVLINELLLLAWKQ